MAGWYIVDRRSRKSFSSGMDQRTSAVSRDSSLGDNIRSAVGVRFTNKEMEGATKRKRIKEERGVK